MRDLRRREHVLVAHVRRRHSPQDERDDDRGQRPPPRSRALAPPGRNSHTVAAASRMARCRRRAGPGRRPRWRRRSHPPARLRARPPTSAATPAALGTAPAQPPARLARTTLSSDRLAETAGRACVDRAQSSTAVVAAAQRAATRHAAHAISRTEAMAITVTGRPPTIGGDKGRCRVTSSKISVENQPIWPRNTWRCAGQATEQFADHRG